MNDFVAIVVSLLCIGSTICLLLLSRCQHTTIDVFSQTCAGCGMRRREIVRRYRQGLDTRPLRFCRVGEDPFRSVSLYLEYRIEKAPPSSIYEWVEYEELSPTAPPHIQRLYKQMLWRRYGIAALWRTRA